MKSVISKIQKSGVFRFLSSVRMAVPLMLVIGCAIAAGTLYEARYNAQVASLVVYRSPWFQGLMILLWINVLFAALSRYPFKRHHLGFVTTHIGILTLLAGGMLTALFGVDGQLRVIEGQDGDQVVLQNLVVKVGQAGSRAGSNSVLTFPFQRSLEHRASSAVGLDRLRLSTGIVAERFVPFAVRGPAYDSTSEAPALAQGSPVASDSPAISFNLKSQFFDVNESLSDAGRNEMQLGPARIRLIVDAATPGKPATALSHSRDSEPPKATPSTSSGRELVVKDASGSKELAHLPLSELESSPKTVGKVRIRLIHVYQSALVDQGKLAEGGAGGGNPALELKLESGGVSLREVAFAKFPTFSLNAKGTFGLRFEYRPGTEGAATSPEGGQAAAAPRVSGSADRAGNVIEFHLQPGDATQARLELFKNGSSVLSRMLHAGETAQTPWMGMKITLSSIGKASAAPRPDRVLSQSKGGEQIEDVEIPAKVGALQSALFVRNEGASAAEGSWILEGDSKVIQTGAGPYEVYFGPDAVSLPFKVHLDKFEKVDYPGTDTAMSFQSTIRIGQGGAPTLISMNEPFKQQGYLLYQSSYEMSPGRPVASIFSVNWDPGREIKYLGAIILVAGIALFTVMRSKWYLNRNRQVAA